MAELRKTSAAKIYGRSPVKGFPLIISCNGIVHRMALSYFLDLFRRGVKTNSIYTYAQQINDFISQLEIDGVSLDNVTDDYLRAYSDDIRGRENDFGRTNSKNYVTQVMRSSVHFLNWLEQEKYIRGVVGEGRFYKVRVTCTKGGNLKHPLIKDDTKDKRTSVTPRSDWIGAVKAHGPEREDLASRFELMVDWGTTLGLRANEICSLRLRQLPEFETAEKAIQNKKLVYIKLTETKGGKEKVVPVSPLLIKKTWVYVFSERSKIVDVLKARAKSSKKIYTESEYIFLSATTGDRLDSRSLSNELRRSFLKAVDAGVLTQDERVWLHGLRHNFTVNHLKMLDAKGVKRPEAIARQVTRHGSEDAMEPYLTDRFNEDFDG